MIPRLASLFRGTDRDGSYLAPEAELSARRVPTRGPISVEDVRWAEPDVRIIEIRVPFDGFRLPEGEVHILWDGPGAARKAASGRVLAEAGTPSGPHQAGMLVRLAVRIESESAWPAGETVWIAWEPAFHLSVRVPNEPRNPSVGG